MNLKYLFLGVFCVAQLVIASPITDVDAEFGITELIQQAPAHTDAHPIYTSENITVPCTLCASAMPSFLDFCREVGGFSIPRISDFVSKCSLIGEDKAKEADLQSGCGLATAEVRSKGRVWNRKLKCLRIYNAMAKMYSPFDPCTQIRLTIDKAPMGVCHASLVRCVPPPTDEPDMLPPWFNNTRNAVALPNELPPLTCPQYVMEVESECKGIKGNNFYARSNLDGFCSSKYGENLHQVSGCMTVVRKMSDQDWMMDLCSSLSSAPIRASYFDYCSKSLSLPSNSSIPDAGYSAYLERVKLYKEAWDMSLPSTATAASTTKFPEDQVVISGATKEQAAPQLHVDISAI